MGEGVGRGMKAGREMQMRPHGLDPLTRLAPAEGSAGDEPPSPKGARAMNSKQYAAFSRWARAPIGNVETSAVGFTHG